MGCGSVGSAAPTAFTPAMEVEVETFVGWEAQFRQCSEGIRVGPLKDLGSSKVGAGTGDGQELYNETFVEVIEVRCGGVLIECLVDIDD